MREIQVAENKTLKLTDEEGAQSIIQRKEDVRKKRAERNRMKRKQKQAGKKDDIKSPALLGKLDK
jgi:hypothetical protein